MNGLDSIIHEKWNGDVGRRFSHFPVYGLGVHRTCRECARWSDWAGRTCRGRTKRPRKLCHESVPDRQRNEIPATPTPAPGWVSRCRSGRPLLASSCFTVHDFAAQAVSEGVRPTGRTPVSRFGGGFRFRCPVRCP